jgi:hypothetical protein
VIVRVERFTRSQTATIGTSTSSATYALPEALFAARYLQLVAAAEIPCTVAVKT